MNRQIRNRWTLPIALLALALLAPGWGGGGSSSGGGGQTLEATFTPSAGAPTPGTVRLEPVVTRATAAAFMIDVTFTGQFDRFFGLAFQLEVPENVNLVDYTPGTIFQGSSMNNEIIAAQDPGTGLVSVVATQTQGSTFDPGVNIPVSTSPLVVTLEFEATAATAGPISFPGPPNREVDQCDVGTETCPAVTDDPGKWQGGDLVVM
jgi:hypothetical protein